MHADSPKQDQTSDLFSLSTTSGGKLHQLLEREIKFDIPPRFHIPENIGAPTSPRVFTSTYYDTAQHRLGQLGLTLRKRIERGRGIWQAKIPSGDYRVELEIESGSRQIPWQFLDLLTAFVRKDELVQLGKIRTWRTGRLIQGKDHYMAEVTVDSIALLRENKIQARFRELEIELKEGKSEHLKLIGKILQKSGAKPKSSQPKIFQVLGLPYPLADPGLEPSTSPSEHIQATLKSQFTQMILHDPGTRLGRDNEDLHQMRVATRRMRAIFRAVRSFLEPEWTKKIREEIGWVGSLLGEVRDWDVLLESLGKEYSSLDLPDKQAFTPILRTFQDERSASRARLLEGLRSDRYVDLLNALEDSLTHLPFQPNHPTMIDLAKKEFTKLEQYVESTQCRFPQQELHRIRTLVKRARYTVELTEPFLGKRAKRFLQHAKSLQEVLGQHQDALVVEGQILSLRTLARSPGVAFAKGILVERFRNRQRMARQQVPRLWKKLKDSGRKLSI
ncbi:MAG: CHAD domain-containing protein [Nitrospirales bacterium]